jgi:nitrogen-specific signal transduction histidine kinase
VTNATASAAAGAGEAARPRRRYLNRGESLIASVGLAAAGVLLLTMAASAWWALREKQEMTADVRQAHVRAVAEQLSHSAEAFLGSNDVSALRRAVIATKRENALTSVRVSLTDGRVLADSDPLKITPGDLPAKFPTGPLDGADEARDVQGQIAFRRPIMVTGRGAAILEVSAPAVTEQSSGWRLGAGLGLLSMAGLAALWLVYRHMRSKVRSLALIREALLAMKAGERCREALEISADAGPEAAAWNDLLREAETLRKGTLLAQLSQGPERRKESKSELELACDSLSVGMILLDVKGKVRHVNGAAASLLGAAREKLVGSEGSALVDDPEIKAAIAGIVSGTSLQRRTAEVTRSHGGAEQTKPGDSGAAVKADPDRGPASVLRVQVRPLRREDTCSAMLTIEDVTQLRVAEAARHTFVAQATHELRTPLTNMRLCLETAIEDGSKDAGVLAKSLNTLNNETRRLERMVSEMLSVAEIEAGSLELHAGDVRLDAVFDALAADFDAPAKEKRIDLKFKLPPKIPVIQADRDKLVLAIHNLIGNAIKYTPEGGKVTVLLRADAQEIAVQVTDTGIGISEQDQPLVFEKFYRAKDPRVEKVTGSGLGLALAMEVAKLHGGGITLNSKLDQGSTFTLTVPVSAQPSRRAA